MAENIRFQYYFSEGSGDTLNDFSYYNDDAAIVEDGSGNWSVDTPFDAGSKTAQLSPYSYDFSGNYFKHTLSESWSSSFTFAIWAKPNGAQELFSSVFSTGDSHNTTNSWQLGVSSNNKWRINDTANQYIINNITEDTWQHLAIVWNYDISYNKQFLKLYFNGELKSTIAYNTSTVLPTNKNFSFTNYKIGVNRNSNVYFIGKLTNAYLYDFAFTDSDIQNLYLYNSDPSGSIHLDCSSCATVTPTSNHIFLPIYLDNNKKVLDNSTNAVDTLDASYNFLMTSQYATADYFRKFIKYKKLNNNYVFSFSNTYKVLFENQLRNDILDTSLVLNGDTFITDTSAGQGNLGRMFIRYIADALMSHPFAQSFIANESDIINTVNNSNLEKQITNAIADSLNISSFDSSDVCMSLLEQFIEQSPSRFLNELENQEYNMPFCSGDYITLFIKMNCDINLQRKNDIVPRTSKEANDVANVGVVNSYGSGGNGIDMYGTLKRIYGSKEEVEFNDSTQIMKIKEKVWRIKILLK